MSQIERLRTDGTVEALADADLATLQDAVGGYVELLALSNGDQMYVNEDGRQMSLPVNIAATEMYRGCTIVGDVVVVRQSMMN